MSGTAGGGPTRIVKYTGTGRRPIPEFPDHHHEGEFEWDETVAGFVVEPGVAKVGDEAFAFCISLRSLVGMNESVTEVGFGVFRCCEALTSLVGLPNGVWDFRTELGG
jgi:hypothetical protein